MLQKCSPTPNCLSSMFPEDSEHYRQPWPFSNPRETVLEKLKNVVEKYGDAAIQEEKNNYVAAEFRIMGFTDDAEFYIPEEENLLHFRSASRNGTWDLGVNGRRLRKIKTMLAMEGVEFTKG